MTASKRGQASRARRRIDDALELLRLSLAEHLAKGSTKQAAPASLDLLRLLSVFIDRVPESGLPRRARTLAHAARDARNEVAHFAGAMTPALALHHLSAVRQLLVDLGADDAVAQLNPIYRAQIAELAAAHPTEEPAPGQRKAAATEQPRPARRPAPTGPSAGSQAHEIRLFVRDYFIGPAARSNRKTATVRAGDVATLMGLDARMPNIVSAIGGRKFESLANVRNQGRTGPKVGADTKFTFAILDSPEHPEPVGGPAPAPPPRGIERRIGSSHSRPRPPPSRSGNPRAARP